MTPLAQLHRFINLNRHPSHLLCASEILTEESILLRLLSVKDLLQTRTTGLRLQVLKGKRNAMKM
jgi:hypothetical protein